MSLKNTENFDYPECWEDDKRMDVLFSPFRLKSVNVESYTSKLKFWKDMVIRFCIHKGAADFSLPEIKRSFVRKNKLPYCLQTVIDDMIANKEIRLKDQFMNDPLNGWSSWAVQSFIKKPLEWAVKKVVYTNPVDEDPTYIHLDVVKEQSRDLNQALSAYAGRVVALENISEDLKTFRLNEEGSKICLRYLHCLRKIYVEYEILQNGNKLTLIKIPSDVAAPAELVSDIEKSIVKLEHAEQNLMHLMNEIETEIKKVDAQCRQYLREGKKLMAKNCLKKKHLLDRKFEQRANALENIQTLIERVKESEHTKPILDAYELGSKTLKSALESTDVNLNKVDEIMLDIKETLESNDDLQQTMKSFQINDSIDEAELEEELEGLLEADKDVEEVKQEAPVNLVDVRALNKSIEDDLMKRLENLTVLNTTLSTLQDTNINATED